MFSLKLFGGARLQDEAGEITGRAVQHHRVALLALLALHRDRPLTRDKLIGYLWPESPGERARGLLSESVYVLRKALGDAALLSARDTLRLNPEFVRCDVAEFEETLAAGNLETAASFYTGPFLDGFFLGDAPEFERWVDGERDRLGRLHRKALGDLATACEARGDVEGAVEWWRRLVAEDPFSSSVALRLMQALVAAGDRAGALRHARAHAELLRREFDAEPDPAVTRFTEQLRAEPPAPELAAASARSASATTQVDGPSGAPGALAAARAGGHRPARGAAVALAAFLLAASALALWQRAATRAGGRPQANLIAVLPFSVRGSDDVAYLGEGMARLLSLNLDGLGELRTVDVRALLGADARAESGDLQRAWSLADRFGASLYVLGDVVEAGGRLRISAALYDGPGGRRVGEALVEGGVQEIFAVVDELARQLVAARTNGPGERLTRLAAVTTPSLPALKAYLEGEREFRLRRRDSALDAYRRAVALDSSFALAHYRLAIVSFWGSMGELALETAETALRLSDRLPLHDRALVRALHALLLGDAAEAERLCREILAAHPDDVEALYILGETLQHRSVLRGRAIRESRQIFRRILELEPDHAPAVWHLVRTAAGERDYAEMDSLLPRIDPRSDDARRGRAIRAFAVGDRAEQDRVAAELAQATDRGLALSAREVAVFSHNLDGAERLARLLAEPSRNSDARARGHLILAQLELARGRRRRAEIELDAAERFDASGALELRALFATHPLTPSTPAALDALRRRLLRWDPTGSAPRVAPPGPRDTVLRSYLLGLLSARLGERSAALEYATALERLEAPPEMGSLPADLAAGLRAQVAWQAEDAEGALAELERAPMQVPIGTPGSPFDNRSLERYTRGELLRALGRDSEALRWFATLAQESFFDLLYLAPAELRQAEIRERNGERDEAAEHYSRFLELWGDADPELRAATAEAERRLARLR